MTDLSGQDEDEDAMVPGFSYGDGDGVGVGGFIEYHSSNLERAIFRSSYHISTDSSGKASALLDLNYGTVSVLVVWVYEHAITFNEEVCPAKIIHLGASLKRLKVAFLKKSKWNIVKMLYLVCRYLPFLFVAINTSHFLQPGLSLKVYPLPPQKLANSLTSM
ncbi:hypothetical protein BU15DRAFT_73574 [Melanogaster broomeanus]|nr:hypothetical protein BU15DRAFT_73574 [Melanogaster broomeanus]